MNQEESVDLAVKTRRNTHSGELRNVPTKRVASCEELLEKGLVDASGRGAGGLQLLEVREKERSHGKEEVEEESEETRVELDH